jgi:hypothetical protein
MVQYRPPGPILIGLPASRQERWPGEGGTCDALGLGELTMEVS